MRAPLGQLEEVVTIAGNGDTICFDRVCKSHLIAARYRKDIPKDLDIVTMPKEGFRDRLRDVVIEEKPHCSGCRL